MKSKSKKGFTLVELVVVVALVAIVGLGVVSIMTPAGNMYAKMQKQAQAKIVASGVMQVIEPQVRFGTNMQIVGSVVSGDSANRYLYADTTGDGRVYEVDKGTTKDLFGSSNYYNGYKITKFDIKVTSSNTVVITLTVTSTVDNTISSSLNTAVQNQNTVTIPDSGNILCYQWLTQPST